MASARRLPSLRLSRICRCSGGIFVRKSSAMSRRKSARSSSRLPDVDEPSVENPSATRASSRRYFSNRSWASVISGVDARARRVPAHVPRPRSWPSGQRAWGCPRPRPCVKRHRTPVRGKSQHKRQVPAASKLITVASRAGKERETLLGLILAAVAIYLGDQAGSQSSRGGAVDVHVADPLKRSAYLLLPT
jgi:hypothetical protein